MKFSIKIITLALLTTCLQVGAASFQPGPAGFIAACEFPLIRTPKGIIPFTNLYGVKPEEICTPANTQAVQAIQAFINNPAKFAGGKFVSVTEAEEFVAIAGVNTALFQANIFPSIGGKTYYQIAMQQIEDEAAAQAVTVTSQAATVTSQGNALQTIAASIATFQGAAAPTRAPSGTDLTTLINTIQTIDQQEKDARNWLSALSVTYDTTNTFNLNLTPNAAALAGYPLKGFIETTFATRLQMMINSTAPLAPLVSLVQASTAHLDITGLNPIIAPTDYSVVETQATALVEAMAKQIQATDAVLQTSASKITGFTLPVGTLEARAQNLITKLETAAASWFNGIRAGGTTVTDEAAVTRFLYNLINPKELKDSTGDVIFTPRTFNMDTLHIAGKSVRGLDSDTYEEKQTVVGGLMRVALEFTQNMLNLTAVKPPTSATEWTGTKQMTDAIATQIAAWKTAATTGGAAPAPAPAPAAMTQPTAIKDAIKQFRENLISQQGGIYATAFSGGFTLDQLTADAPTNASTSKQVGNYYRQCAEAANLLKTLAGITTPAQDMKDLMTQSDIAIRAKFAAAAVPAVVPAPAAISQAVIDGHNAAVDYVVGKFNKSGLNLKKTDFTIIIPALNNAVATLGTGAKSIVITNPNGTVIDISTQTNEIIYPTPATPATSANSSWATIQ